MPKTLRKLEEEKEYRELGMEFNYDEQIFYSKEEVIKLIKEELQPHVIESEIGRIIPFNKFEKNLLKRLE